MATQAQVLQEFVYALGFKIDEAGGKKFRAGLSESSKDAMKLGGAMIGVGIVVEQFVSKMAEGMEKLYFASQRTGASVQELRNFEGAAQRIGMGAGQVTAMLESMNMAIQKSPGLQGVLARLGIDPKSLNTAEKMSVVLDHLKGMFDAGGSTRAIAYQIGEKYFGWADKDMLQIMNNYPDWIAQQKKINELWAEGGMNQQKMADQGHEAMNSLRDTGTEFEIIANKIGGPLMVNMKKFLDEGLNPFLRDVVKATVWIGKMIDKFNDISAVKTSNTKTRSFLNSLFGVDTPPPAPASAAAPAPASAAAPASAGGAKGSLDARLTAAEEQYGLPKGTLHATAFIESSFGTDPKMNEGDAKGLMQITSATAALYHMKLEDRLDEDKSIAFAARLMKEGLTRRNGDLEMAFADYNAGPPAVNRAINAGGPNWEQFVPRDKIAKPGSMPYGMHAMASLNSVAPGANQSALASAGDKTTTVTQHVNFRPSFVINGTNSGQISTMTADKVNRLYGDVVRNTKSAMVATQ